MRAGPLSSPTVINRLNARFVPVFVVNEDHDDAGPAPAEEKAESRRIYREALDAGLSAGTVHAYVLNPAGHTVASLHVAEAAQTDRLLAMLERTTSSPEFSKDGPPLLPPRSLSAPPKTAPGSLVLHLTARGRGSSWDGFPSENWIVLDPAQQAGLLPPGELREGTTWPVRDDVATAILTHFYPQTENNDVSTHRFERRSLRGKVVELKDGLARSRLEGDLRMAHAFYPHREDGNFVEAPILGLLDFDPTTHRIHRLRLVTDGATYGQGHLDVAVRSTPD